MRFSDCMPIFCGLSVLGTPYDRPPVVNEIPQKTHERKDQALVDLKNEFECIWVHMNIPFITRKRTKYKFFKLIGKITLFVLIFIISI